MAASSTTIICDHCGFHGCTSTDRPDAIRIECPACGSVEWIWKDNEEEDYLNDPDYQAFVAEAAKRCRCSHGPCAGVLAGGFCDELDFSEEDDE